MKPAAEPTAAEPTAAEDLAILFPDVDVAVRDPDTGETVDVTVRELRFLEGLRLSGPARPLIEAFAASISSEDDAIDESAVAAAMTEHAEAWLACLAAATGRDVEWLGRLPDKDGHALSGVMWSVNAGFFGRRFIEAVRRRRRPAGPSPSPKSSMPWCAPATDAGTATSPSA